MTQKHTDVVKTMIRTVPAFATKTFQTVAVYPYPASAQVVVVPWVVVHPADGTDAAERYTGPKTVQRPRWTLHIVGETSEQVGTLLALLKAKFVVNGFGVTPTIPGENARRFFWEQPTPIQVDKDVSPELVYAVIEIGFDSTIL